MQSLLTILMAAVVGYLLGSIPVGLWVCRLYGVDIRTVGSGRTGGTNAWRAAGLKAAIPTIVGDAIKGALAVWLVRAGLAAYAPATPELVRHFAVALAAGAAVWGHNWSLFIGFRGGAGGITGAVTCMALSPIAGTIVWCMGAGLIWWSRMASVGTLGVGLSAAATLLVLGIAGITPWPYLLFGLMTLTATFLSLARNRENLRSGSERVISLW